MNKRYVTIVSDQEGNKASYHSSWKSACETYNWDHVPRVPKIHNGFKIIKAPLDVSIDCLDLIEFLSRKEIAQNHYDESGYCISEVYGYDIEYRINSEYHTRTEPADYHSGDRGMETVSESYDYDEITDVLTVELMTEDGSKEIELDKWTYDFVKGMLVLTEKL